MPKLTRLAQALSAAALLSFLPAQAAPPTNADLLAEMRRLAERVEKLEQHNADLERQLKTRDIALPERVKALEEQNARLEQSLADENIRETEPEIASRLKAVEYQALSMQKQVRMIDKLENITAGASLSIAAQKASSVADRDVQLNYRTDITVATPAGTMGDTTAKIFGHFRIGQGKGLGSILTAFSGANATAFQLGTAEQADTSAVMLAQAWYQADIPLPVGGFKPRSRETLTINFGKMDPFAFFDQNAAANDETRQFLASQFVHNALLDNPLAANVGADAYGFTPGVRVSYLNEKEKPESWRLSLGVFGAGPGASFSKSFTSPFVIVQAEQKKRFFTGQEGNYRIYLWRNGQAPTYAVNEALPHRGIGVNFDQRVGDAVTLFGRFGKGWGERLPFDQTLSLGAEFGGGYWERGADAIGLAFGANRVSEDFRRDAATLDANGDGTPDYGFAASGTETVAEAYYRYRLNSQFEVTPDFQLIQKPAGNGSTQAVKIFGVRAQLMF